MKNKNKFIYDCILFFPILVVYLIYFINSFKVGFYSSPYAFNELFINYNSGFIRRGFLGGIFYFFYEKFQTKPLLFFGIIFGFLHFLYILIFFKIISKFKNFFYIKILIIYSPALIFFPIYDTNIYFIKDIFSKIIIALHALIAINYRHDQKKYLKILNLVIIPLIFFSTIFIHEYQIFFSGFHILISIATFQKKEFFKYLKNYLFLIIALIIVFSFSGNENNLIELNTLLKKDFDIQINTYLGGGLYKYIGGAYKWYFYYFNYSDFVNLLFSIILSVGIFFIIFQNLINIKGIIIPKNLEKKYFFFFFPCLALLLVADHGRNLSLFSNHLIFFFLSCKFNLDKCKILYNSIIKNINYFSILIILIILNTFMWKLDQFAGFGWGGKPFTIFKSSLMTEFINFINFLYNYISTNIIELPKINL